MISPTRHRNRVTAAGFSLVELMISVVIGLIVLGSVAAAFVSSRQTFKTQQGLAQLQETGRLLNFLLYPYVRQAGYLPNPLTQIDPEKFFVGDPDPAKDRRAIWGADNAAGLVAGVSPQPGTDVIVARFFGRDSDSDPSDIEGQLRTCQDLPGGIVGGLADNQMAENVFFVRRLEGGDADIGDAGIGSLSCRARVYTVDEANGAITLPPPRELPPQPLVLGVQDMQVLYGIDSDADNAPNQYVPASAVTDWQQVVSVRITVAVAGGNPTELSLGDTEDVTTEQPRIVDGRIRRTFTTTLQIRNLLRS